MTKKSLRLDNLETRTAMNAKNSVLVFVLKRSYIYYIICMTVPSNFPHCPGQGREGLYLILIKNRYTLRNIKITQHKHTKTIL